MRNYRLTCVLILIFTYMYWWRQNYYIKYEISKISGEVAFQKIFGKFVLFIIKCAGIDRECFLYLNTHYVKWTNYFGGM